MKERLFLDAIGRKNKYLEEDPELGFIVNDFYPYLVIYNSGTRNFEYFPDVGLGYKVDIKLSYILPISYFNDCNMRLGIIEKNKNVGMTGICHTQNVRGQELFFKVSIDYRNGCDWWKVEPLYGIKHFDELTCNNEVKRNLKNYIMSNSPVCSFNNSVITIRHPNGSKEKIQINKSVSEFEKWFI